MPTKNPRVNIVFDAPLLETLKAFASQQHQSVSSAAKELIAQALELHEDYCLSNLADKRMQKTEKMVSHEDAWR